MIETVVTALAYLTILLGSVLAGWIAVRNDRLPKLAATPDAALPIASKAKPAVKALTKREPAQALVPGAPANTKVRSAPLDDVQQWGRVSGFITESIGRAHSAKEMHGVAAQQLEAVDYSLQRLRSEVEAVGAYRAAPRVSTNVAAAGDASVSQADFEASVKQLQDIVEAERSREAAETAKKRSGRKTIAA